MIINSIIAQEEKKLSTLERNIDWNAETIIKYSVVKLVNLNEKEMIKYLKKTFFSNEY